MADVKVRTVELTLTTMKLGKSLLKQFERIHYNTHNDLFGKEGIKKELVVGWIHGAALGDEFAKFLLVRIEEGRYGLCECGMGDWKPYKQIYV